MSCGQLSPGPGSADANYVFAKGFLANGSGSEDARNENNWHAQRILTAKREKSSKHACGVVIEVSI